MKIRTHEPTTHERWANLRFSVVGHLLAAPPARGELQRELERLAEKKWRHPITSAPTMFGVSTIERWYYEQCRSDSAKSSTRLPNSASGREGYPERTRRIMLRRS
jgi:hypothetical protein